MRRKLRTMKGLDITSLIDVMFILVIFFMVSSTLVVHPGMRVKVPDAKNSKKLAQDKMVVYVDKDNLVYLNDKKVEKLDLRNEVKYKVDNGAAPHITVKADKEVNYGEIISVIDICKEAGIQDISFSTNKVDRINYSK